MAHQWDILLLPRSCAPSAHNADYDQLRTTRTRTCNFSFEYAEPYCTQKCKQNNELYAEGALNVTEVGITNNHTSNNIPSEDTINTGDTIMTISRVHYTYSWLLCFRKMSQNHVMHIGRTTFKKNSKSLFTQVSRCKSARAVHTNWQPSVPNNDHVYTSKITDSHPSRKLTTQCALFLAPPLLHSPWSAYHRFSLPAVVLPTNENRQARALP